jgi:hypothetical protein
VTLPTGITAIMEKRAPLGFQHWLHPQALKYSKYACLHDKKAFKIRRKQNIISYAYWL